jgi:Tfp pilus assembly protein PilP
MRYIMHTGNRKRAFASALLFLPLVAWGSAGVDCAAAAQLGAAAAKSLAQKAAKPAQATAKSADVKQPESKADARAVEGKLRDPFSIPKPIIVNESAEGQGAEGTMIVGPVPAGTRGLIIDQIKLEGIVRVGSTNPKMIAVMANPANRAYFLHENDPLYNGAVTKITPDTVYFREDYRDSTGKMLSREVTKQLAPAPGEKK